jgi:hypothetical protein
MRTLPLALLLLSATAAPAWAQRASLPTRTAAAGPIQDNSFLIEEAYNQEPGVVQHIGFFQDDLRAGWFASFSQEWPLGSLKHQISYTIPASGGAGTPTGLGDVALNYRYQLVGDGDARLAVAPRLSVLFPTGNEERGQGTGALGVQMNLPVSLVLAPKWVAHTNAGFTYAGAPDGEDDDEESEGTNGLNAGQSVVWLARPDVNLLLEAVWTRMRAPNGDEDTFFLSPGVRMAVDFPGGLQVVPGMAVPLGVGPSGGDRAVLLYLSLEHPFSRRGREGS